LVPLVQSGGLGSARTLLNPKPPDPEAAFAFLAHLFFRPRFPKNRLKARAASKLEAWFMSRSTPTLTRASTTAFDFDVVTDVTPRLSRKPDAAPEPARPDPGAQREPAKSAKAG
jgi:hypothetical protein